LWEEIEEMIMLCEQRERADSDTSGVILGQRIIEKALLYDGKSGQKHSRRAYGKTEKYGEGFTML